MSFKECMRKAFIMYFVLAALIALAIGLIGMAFDPQAALSYASLLIPLKYAAFCVLPTFVMISRKELTMGQYLLRKALQLVLVEAEIYLIGFRTMELQAGAFAVIALSVVVVFVLANVVGYINDLSTAKQMNSDLKRFQNS